MPFVSQEAEFSRECSRADGPLSRFNAALMSNFNTVPWGFAAFRQLGKDAWPKVMPNDDLPSIFADTPPKSLKQEFEEMERRARQSAVAPPSNVVTEIEEESDQEPAGYPLAIDSAASSYDSPMTSNSALPAFSSDLTSAGEDVPLDLSAANKAAPSEALRFRSDTLDLKRGREPEDNNGESSSSSSTSKRPQFGNFLSSARRSGKAILPAFPLNDARRRSPKAHHAFLTDSSSSKRGSVSRQGVLKRARDDAPDVEVDALSAHNSNSAKRRRVEAETCSALPMPTRAINRNDKVSSWLVHGTLAAPVPEPVETDAASEANESDYDVNAGLTDDEMDDETPRLVSMKGRTVAERFQARKKVHYAGSDAADDEEPMPFWKVAEVLRYAVPNPGNWA